jgi:hypothetical protein
MLSRPEAIHLAVQAYLRTHFAEPVLSKDQWADRIAAFDTVLAGAFMLVAEVGPDPQP